MHVRSIGRLVGLSLLLALVAAVSPAAAGDTFEIPVKEKILDNGLKVLVVENATAQTVSCRLVYRVGSANEQPGLTGLAHFFEHLMFKGTKRIGVKDLEEDARLMEAIDGVADEIRTLRLAGTADDDAGMVELESELAALILEQRDVVEKNETMEVYRKAGGTGINASTSRDMTQYQVTLPANKLELFMWLESDRLANAVFREFHAEKDVVREERRLSENRPTHAFNEALTQITFGSHPYAWPVVGWHEDLLNATREDAKAFFETFYVPDNAVIVLAGNVKANEAFTLAKRYFGAIPRGTRSRPVVGQNPPRAVGERRLVARAATQPMVDATYYRHPIGHADEPVYQIIGGLLSGSSGRLEQEIVRKKDLATRVGASGMPSRYISTFTITGTTKGDTAPEAVLEAIDIELHRLKTERVASEELQKAKNGFRARMVQILKSDAFLSMMLGYYDAMDARRGWRGLNESIKLIDAVTASDVQRVAKELFRTENRVVGILHGMDDVVAEGGADTTETTPAVAETPTRSVTVGPNHPDELVFAERKFDVPNPGELRVVLPSGLRVFIKRDDRLPTVRVTAHVQGGSLWEPAAKVGLASATGELMKRGGTAKLDEDALDRRLDFLAASLSSGFGETSGSVSLSCFDRDVDECLGYFKDVLLAPAFRADRLERWKEESLQAIARRNDSPARISGREFQIALYGDHPTAWVSSPESVTAISRDDLVAFHRGIVSPKTTILSVAGNFETEAMLGKLKDVFGEWEGEAPRFETPAQPVAKKPAGVLFIEKASSQGYVSLGHLGIRRDHEDYDALNVMNSVLRRRIFNRVRTDEGLAYSAYSRFSAPDLYAGIVGAGFQSKSESVAFALQLVFEEIEKIRTEAIPTEELQSVKQGLIDAFPGRFSSAEAIVSMFAGQELRGRPLSDLADYRERVAAQTAEGILAAAKRHVHPDRMTIQIVGDRKAILAGDGTHAAKITDFGSIIDVELAAPTVAKKVTPSSVVAQAVASLKSGDIDALLACFTDEVAERMGAQRAALEARIKSPLVQGIEIEVKDEVIDGDVAKVDVVFKIDMGGQKIEQPRTLRLAKVGETWKLADGLF